MADIDRCVESEPATMADFDIFWAAYPNKKGKLDAQRRWNKMKERPPLAVLLAAIEAQKKSKQWLRDNGQYIKHPATWLHKGCWLDEVEEQKQAEHAERIAENRKTTRSELVDRITRQFELRDDDQGKKKAWRALTPAEVREIRAARATELGVAKTTETDAMNAWWREKGA